MAEQKLKPCPFCGGEAESDFGFDHNNKTYFYVTCLKCGGETNHYKTKAEAITAWNPRPENPLLEELKQYKDAIKAIEKYTRPNEGEEIDNIDRIATFCNWATKQIEGKMVITTCGPVIITDEKDRTQAIAEAKEQIK